MRVFLILGTVIAAVIFLAPVIVGLIVFSLCAVAIVILLARLGFLPGFRFVRYGGDVRRGKSSWRWNYQGRGNRDSYSGSKGRSETNRDNSSGWYQTSQEGEEITLPETALQKEDDKTNKGG